MKCSSCSLVLFVCLSLSAVFVAADSNGTVPVSSSTTGGLLPSTTGAVTTGISNTNSTGSTTGSGSPNDTNSGVCGSSADCSSCISSTDCIWCESSSTCQSGHWFGPQNSCTDWRWKQCFVRGLYTLFAAIGVIVLVFLCIFICLCRCFCCTRRKSKNKLKDFKEFKTLKVLDEEKETLISKPTSHPKTDERRAELMKKYGSKLSSV